ncbi:MAG: (Fe-S)-binding protein [Calditrichia bacterium]|nr:(Fe-S)-binding protein [Calditrichia bacterium]
MKTKLINESDYLACIRCGLCLSACPTYREFKTETASPRGRVALTRKGLDGELELSPNLFEQMYSCFDCLACRDVCPVEVNPAKLSVNMRVEQEAKKPARWKIPLFEKLIPKPENMEIATWPLRLYQRLGIRWLYYKLGLWHLMPKKLRDLEAMLPHLPTRPLRQVIPEKALCPGDENYKVGFFLSCAQSLMFAETSNATIRVLNRNKCSVFTPKETKCCGVPLLSYGKRETAEKLAKHNIELFEKLEVDVIVTDCATCGSNLKEYNDLLADYPEWLERATNFSQKVKDISEFLHEIPLEKPLGQLNARVTYHDPCHLRRGQNVWQQPRELLKLINGLEFLEMEEADWCCGSAGSQLITHYDTSIKVLGRKIGNLKSTQAEIIASGCPGCQMQLNVGIKREKLKVKVIHPVELLDQAYQAGDKS